MAEQMVNNQRNIQSGGAHTMGDATRWLKHIGVGRHGFSQRECEYSLFKHSPIQSTKIRIQLCLSYNLQKIIKEKHLVMFVSSHSAIDAVRLLVLFLFFSLFII